MRKQYFFVIFLFSLFSMNMFSQPSLEPGVSHELAIWRAKHYSDVRYKLNLTLEKMSPVLKGEIEIKLSVASALADASKQQIILDWRKPKGKEESYSIKDVMLNGSSAEFEEINEHLVIKNAVQGENIVKLDFTSPISTSGSAITRYIDKEDGSEYIYSLFVPSDASTAFPVFDQPDLKARFQFTINTPRFWNVISNTQIEEEGIANNVHAIGMPLRNDYYIFKETQPISTYVFAFAVGEFTEFRENGEASGYQQNTPLANFPPELTNPMTKIYVRKSQAEKFKQHSAEVFRLSRECIKYLEGYFDYKFPFPKYDLVLIPEFPFGGMEHAGATFLRESSIIFPSEPTKNDIISRANLIFHEAAHQWFGDTVTMKWFDDLWLKEGFAEFMAYKTLEKVMPEMNAWKAFYERNKQLAYLTDSTKGTTPIYQEIANLSSAKSAYGNIVYRKAPSFLRQAEFYLGEKEFQTAVRSFLKKYKFKNAEWLDLVKGFEKSSKKDLKNWSETWIKKRGLPIVHLNYSGQMFEMTTVGCNVITMLNARFQSVPDSDNSWISKTKVLVAFDVDTTNGRETRVTIDDRMLEISITTTAYLNELKDLRFIFPNYQDYGYGIFLLDEKSRNYVLANVQNEKDDFLRSMMYGSLWDSVREAELDPKDFVELAIKNVGTEKDEMIVSAILSRTNTAFAYYLDEKTRNELSPKLENVLFERMKNAETLGQRITFYRAFLNVANSLAARKALKDILRGERYIVAGTFQRITETPKGAAFVPSLPELRTKDKFDIVTKLFILNDPDAPKLLEDLRKTETSDDAKRYAYAARAGIATAENKAKYFNDFVANKDISESWIESAFIPFNSTKHSDLTIQYLEKALAELPNLKRNRKIFFVNGWLSGFIGGQKSEEALGIVNKFLADNPKLDKDLRLKILENVDVIERAVKIRKRK
jgi:aminopeptidase N